MEYIKVSANGARTTKQVPALKAGKLYLVGGQNGVGKTRLVMKILADFSVLGGKTAVYMPLEKDVAAAGAKMAEAFSGVRLNEAGKTKVAKTQWGKLIKAVDALSAAPVYIGDILPSEGFFNEVRKFAAKNKPELVVIDNGGMLRPYPQGKGKDALLGEMKKLATEIKAAVMLVTAAYPPEKGGKADFIIDLGGEVCKRKAR